MRQALSAPQADRTILFSVFTTLVLSLALMFQDCTICRVLQYLCINNHRVYITQASFFFAFSENHKVPRAEVLNVYGEKNSVLKWALIHRV